MNKPIEQNIKQLVDAMNAHGMVTYASCEGHELWLGNARLPYVAFRCEQVEAVRHLCLHLRMDAIAQYPALSWGWEITAGFDADIRLVYRLAPTAPHRKHYRLSYRLMVRDFGFISNLLEKTGNHRDPPDRVMTEEIPWDSKESESTEKEQSKHFVIESSAAERISGIAAIAGRSRGTKQFPAIYTFSSCHTKSHLCCGVRKHTRTMFSMVFKNTVDRT
jgi:hypothetical protein